MPAILCREGPSPAEARNKECSRDLIKDARGEAALTYRMKVVDAVLDLVLRLSLTTFSKPSKDRQILSWGGVVHYSGGLD